MQSWRRMALQPCCRHIWVRKSEMMRTSRSLKFSTWFREASGGEAHSEICILWMRHLPVGAYQPQPDPSSLA